MINKIGVAAKIKTVVSSDKEFEALRDEIVQANQLVRCIKCGKLLAKVGDGRVSVKRKDVDLLVKTTEAKIKCPVCSTCNDITI